MSKNVLSACRKCRAEGVKLFLKGDRCLGHKCPLVKQAKSFSTTTKVKKKSYFGTQLREKQKVKRFYGLIESQFKKYYKIASAKEGNTGSLFIEILERRLDNVIYRMGFAVSRAQARQMVSHRFIRLNGIRVNIPSILVKVGDVIELDKKVQDFFMIQDNLKRDNVVPEWIQKTNDFSGKIVELPDRENVNDLMFQEQMIVELYSR